MWSPTPSQEKQNQGDDLSKIGIDDCCLDEERVCVWDRERRGFGARGKEREVENNLTWWEKKE